MTSEISSNKSSQEDTKNTDPIVQYILVRTDLNWSTGALIAQACHASVAAITTTYETASTKAYLADIDNMHKIILKAENVEQLTNLKEKLDNISVPHHLWIEKPENTPTCLACSPQSKPLVQAIFKHFKLFR